MSFKRGEERALSDTHSEKRNSLSCDQEFADDVVSSIGGAVFFSRVTNQQTNEPMVTIVTPCQKLAPKDTPKIIEENTAEKMGVK